MVGLQWFLIVFFFFSFYVVPNIVKYFQKHFPKFKQTQEKQIFSCKSFAFTNILRWRIFYSETNGALVTNNIIFSYQFTYRDLLDLEEEVYPLVLLYNYYPYRIMENLSHNMWISPTRDP